MRVFIFTSLFCLSLSLVAQSRQAMDTPQPTRDIREEHPTQTDGFETSVFNPFQQNDFLVTENGTAIISKYHFGPAEGEFVILPVPGPADKSRFALQAISPNGEETWVYRYAEDIRWAGSTTLSGNYIYFVVQAPATFPGEGEDETPADPAGTQLAGSMPINLVVCVDATTGTELWQEEIPGAINSIKAGPNGSVYVSYARINAFDGIDTQLAAYAATGQSLWDVTTTPAETLGPNGER